MTEEERPDDGLLTMIKRAINPKQEAEPTEESVQPEAAHEDPVSASEPVLEPIAAETNEPVDKPERVAEPTPVPMVASAQSQRRTVDEIQKMILDALTTIPDAPKDGMTITVYGYNPWNTMVTFAPGSVNISTAAMIRSALSRLVKELRARVAIEIPPH